MRSLIQSLSSARIFIIARVSLGLLLFFYWFDLYLDRAAAFFIQDNINWSTWAACFGILGSISSISLVLGFARRTSSAALCILLLAFIYYSPFAANVSHGYLSFLLLVLVFIPGGENWQNTQWETPREYMWALWFVTSVSYLETAIDKIRNPIWSKGQAVQQLLEYSLAVRDHGLNHYIRSHPQLSFSLNWSVIAVEILFAILTFVPRARIFAWAAIALLHIGVLATMGIYYISAGMLIFHLFLLTNADFIKLRRMRELAREV